MRIMNPRFRRFLRVTLLFSFLFMTLYLVISGSARKRIRIMFSPSCLPYNQKSYSNRLNDRIVDYSGLAKKSGIEECRNEKEIRENISRGNLVWVGSKRSFIIDRMTFSYPCLTPGAEELLDEIGRRFRERTNMEGLRGSKFIVTSMTRTTEKMKGLRRNNTNVSANSPHLNGNAFDISYVRFKTRKLFVTSCDRKFFKETLAMIITDLRDEKKCWATYERNQTCFHVVAR